MGDAIWMDRDSALKWLRPFADELEAADMAGAEKSDLWRAILQTRCLSEARHLTAAIGYAIRVLEQELADQPQQQPPPRPPTDAVAGVPVPTTAEQTLCPGEDLRECGQDIGGQQPPPQQEQGLSPLAQALANDDPMGALQALETDGVIGEIDPDDANLMLPICTAVAELLRHQEQEARADERARVVVAIEAMKDRATIWRDKHGPETKEGHAFEYQRLGYEVLADFLRQRLGGEG